MESNISDSFNRIGGMLYELGQEVQDEFNNQNNKIKQLIDFTRDLRADVDYLLKREDENKKTKEKLIHILQEDLTSGKF